MAQDSETDIEGLRQRADDRFATVLRETGIPDPRDGYRQWLRELRSRDEAAFRKALEYYEKQLVAAVADPQSDPLREWTEYGLRLAQRLSPGSAVGIDTSGLSRPTDAEAAADELVLHLPASARQKALVVRLPARLSPAQEATYGLLVTHALE